MKLIQYQTYYIATDANHVTQHRRFVTPWFYVRLKSIRYVCLEKGLHVYTFMGILFSYRKKGWVVDDCSFVNFEVEQKLKAVTLPFSFDERMGK